MKKKFEHQERRGLPGGPNEMFTYTTGVFSTNTFSTEGYKRNSPDVNNPYNIIPSGNITMKDVDFPVHGVDNLGNEQMMTPGNDYQFPGDMVFETPMAQTGYEVPKRRGVRLNYDDKGNVVSESTHLMATETDGKGNWFSFPTLFQNSIPYADDSKNWVDMSDRPWEEAYEEAKKRNEVIEFGKDKEAAIKFGEGSWKPKMKRGGGLLTKTMKCNNCSWEWKAADGGNDVSTCHKCGSQALPKAQEGEETKPWESKPSIDPAMYTNATKEFIANERKKQLIGEALKANKNNPQFQAIQQRDKDIETLKGSGVNPARLYMKYNDQGSIDQYEEPGFEEQALNYLANPLTTLGYLARGEQIPNLVQDKDNPIDMALETINPFAWGDYGMKAADDLSEGDFVGAGLNALGAIPTVPAAVANAKNITRVVNKIPAKINPNYFTPNSNMYYRGLGKEGVEDALQSRVFRPNQNVKPNITGGFDLAKDFNTTQVGTYYSPNFNVADKYGKGFIAEVPGDAATFGKRYKGSDWSMATKDQIPIDKGRILEKNWWSGYKPVEVPKQLPGSPNTFKSEIDWAKWNKEIPENKALMQEYNAIEQQAKADGTWMKNVDGSEFKGTPEQFVQQNSKNFKKAYSNGYEKVFRGMNSDNPLLLEKEGYTGVFTGNKKLAKGYGNHLHELAMKNSDNSITFNAVKDDWLDLNFANRTIDSQTKNINLNKKHLEKLKARNANPAIIKSTQKNIEQLENGLNQTIKANQNPLYKKMVEYFKGQSDVATDDIATYLEKQGLDNVQIKNVLDGDFGDINISNQVSGNYLKSLIGNNGMFDMTNPNIYKALVPLIGMGAFGAATSQSEELPENKYGGVPKAQFGIEPKDYTTFVDNVGPAKSDGASYVSDAQINIEKELYETNKEPIVKEPTLKDLYDKQEKKEQEILNDSYTIKKGDNLSAIANKFNVSIDDIIKSNNISNPRLIFPNQILKIPKKLNIEEKWQPVEEIAKKTKEINNMSDEDVVIKGQSINNPSQRYILVDKKTNRLKVYAGDKIISSMEIVPGATISDAQTVTKNYLKNKNDLIEKQKLVGVNPDGDFGPITQKAFKENNINFKPIWETAWKKGNKSTGAGVYKISNTSPTSSSHYAYAPSFNMVNERGIEVSTAIHGTANKNRLATFGNDAERKAKFKKLPFDEFWDEWMTTTGFTADDIKNTTYDEALNDLVVADNRMSNGCINGKCKDLEALYSLGLPVGTPVYILPEDKGNKFQIVDGKPVLRMSKKNRETYEDKYIDQEGNEQDSQGSNYSINTLTYKPIKGMLDNSFPDKYVLDESKQNYRPEYINATLPFIKGIEDAKKDVMKIAKIPSDVYNEIAKMTFGIYGAESNYGLEESGLANLIRAGRKVGYKAFGSKKSISSPDVVSKYYTYGINDNNNSVGYTQVRFSHTPFINNKPLKYDKNGEAEYKGSILKGEPNEIVVVPDLNDIEKNALNSIGIFSNEDFLDPVKAAKGTAMLLAIRYNQELSEKQKKDIWKNLPKKWNRASNYPTRVKDNSKSLQFGQLDKLKTGGEVNDLDVYKNYINGFYDKTKEKIKAEEIYDKLNRVYYKEAKANNTSVPNYIMSNIISKSV